MYREGDKGRNIAKCRILNIDEWAIKRSVHEEDAIWRNTSPVARDMPCMQTASEQQTSV